MKCNNCSKELPQGSQFCPYCLHKFTPETLIVPKSKRERNTGFIIALVAVFTAFLIIAALILRNGKTAENEASPPGTETQADSLPQPSATREDITEGEYYVTDENGNTTFPPATYVVVVEEDGSVKEGFILPE
ncbi:MAG: zinc ribbon domain-containing protein [Clostridia bacterium]|nr:zinc ribbon domain-containing protein [Clostridia bacterium]